MTEEKPFSRRDIDTFKDKIKELENILSDRDKWIEQVTKEMEYYQEKYENNKSQLQKASFS